MPGHVCALSLGHLLLLGLLSGAFSATAFLCAPTERWPCKSVANPNPYGSLLQAIACWLPSAECITQAPCLSYSSLGLTSSFASTSCSPVAWNLILLALHSVIRTHAKHVGYVLTLEVGWVFARPNCPALLTAGHPALNCCCQPPFWCTPCTSTCGKPCT